MELLKHYPAILLFVFLSLSAIFLLIFNRVVFNRIARQVLNWKFFYCICLVIILFLTDWIFLDGATHELSETLYNHAWIEVASGFVIYLLLEYKIKEYGEVPTDDGERDYKWILNGLAKSKRTARIIDNDFTSFFEGENESFLKARLKEKLISCLKSLDRKQRLEILLLHPDTLAARQRHDDLLDVHNKNGFVKEFDLYERMNAGLQFLFEFLKNDLVGLKDASGIALDKKIEVKLFNTSYSLSFVAWDQFINFSLFHPEKFTDEETFKTLRHTPLAEYFIENFKEIWKDERTIDLIEYKRIIIQDDRSNVLAEDVPWGPDSHDHDLPAFIRIVNDKQKKLLEYVHQQDRIPVVQIIHDRRILRATLVELTVQDEQDESEQDQNNRPKVMKNIVEYAKGQIFKKSRELSENATIYHIKYANQQRIMLQDENYVRKNLEARGYCFTPHTKYVVFMGLHLKKMLNALYHFYTELYRKIENEETGKRPYKRLLAHYTCFISNRNEVTVKNTDKSKFSFFQEVDFQNNNGFTREEILVLDEMNNFLKRTIEADILRIHGLQLNKSGNPYNLQRRYHVTVHLIQAKVNHEKYVPDRFDDSYEENEGLYTALHFIGKKNITGGMPSIYIGESKISEKNYNFNSTLDSIYVKTTGGQRGRIIVDSSATRYNEQAAKQNIEKELLRYQKNGSLTEEIRQKIESENAYGYRNLIAVEFKEQKGSQALN